MDTTVGIERIVWKFLEFLNQIIMQMSAYFRYKDFINNQQSAFQVWSSNVNSRYIEAEKSIINSCIN